MANEQGAGQEINKTIYIHPGYNSCNVYAIPPLKQGQSPRDIAPEYRQDWKQIGKLDARLNIVWLDEQYWKYASDIRGQMGGTFFTV